LRPALGYHAVSRFEEIDFEEIDFEQIGDRRA
jgi:hypothetical protein